MFRRRQYTPVLEDNVVGVVREKQGEQFKIDIGASHIANLPFLAFEGATKRNRPNLEVLLFFRSLSRSRVDYLCGSS